MKRLRSTETLGATSAICSDKTGTLTLNQMTAVELTIPGRRYTVSGTGYSTEGQIKHVAGEPEVALEQFMLPLALACDAVVTADGEMIGDPTEGALVVLAEKGGLDVDRDPRALPARRRAAVRHRLQADGHLPPHDRRVRAGRRALLRQGRARPAPGAGLVRTSTRRWPTAPADDDFKARYLAENERLAAPGPARDGDRTQGLRPRRASTPAPTCSTLMDGLTLLALVASSIRPARRPRRRSRPPTPPGSRSA